MTEQPKISVIIPMYNAERSIVACLSALQQQTLDRGQFEIIVADNGSSDASIEAAKGFDGVVILHESTPGSYAARNTGIQGSSNPVLAFLDADCVAAPDWLEKGLASLSAIGLSSFVGGEIVFRFARIGQPSLIEQYDSMTYLNNHTNVVKLGFSVTANLFTSREVFEQVGFFNTAMKSGGDREWCNRVSAADMPYGYAPDAIIYHEARKELGGLIKKTRRVVSGLLVVDQGPDITLTFTLSQLVPPLKRIKRTLADASLGSVVRRVQLSGLQYFFKLVTFVELLKLRTGRDAER